jgi:hypothetical protein
MINVTYWVGEINDKKDQNNGARLGGYDRSREAGAGMQFHGAMHQLIRPR